MVGEVAVHAVQGITSSIGRGELVAIMGTSGSGKSTLMNILGCLDRPTTGTYLLEGSDTSELSQNELSDLRNQKIGFVFQGFNLLDRLTAIENIELPLICRAGRRARPTVTRQRALQCLEEVGLTDRGRHLPAQLSGGQQQRVAIARALVNEPDLILADEPTGNLDSTTSIEIMGIFEGLHRRGITIVLVTHEPKIARYSTRVMLIRDGRLVHDRPQALRNERVIT